MNMKLHSNEFEQTIDYYNQNAEQFIRETFALDMREIYKPFIELLPTKAKVLDAGCGSGRDSLFFLEQGFDVTAFDASAELVRKASELTKLNVLEMTFDKVKWENLFDGVWACASLLHVPKSQIESVFAKLLNSLKMNGVLYASFKLGKGEEMKNGRFFAYYSKAEILKIVSLIISNKDIKHWENKDFRNKNGDQMWINLIVKNCN